MFDFNIHLPCGGDALTERLCDEGSMSGYELSKCFNYYLPAMEGCIDSANFMLFNESLSTDDASSFSSLVRSHFKSARFTILGDIHADDSAEKLSSLKESGVDAVKFHCYFQSIRESDFPKVMHLAKTAVELNMPIFIDASYGSTGMYCYDNLKLAAYVLEEIKTVPVVLLHSGGARAMEAFLLADACPNVFLDTSFSVPYYLGSSIETDLAFAYKKVGSERVIYGSDFPYISFEESLSKTKLFFERNKFSESDCETIFSGISQRLFEWG